MKDVQFFSQFCEDVRQEANNRFSLMGLYPAAIILGSREVVTKLRISVQASIHIAAPIAAAGIKTVVSFNDKVLREMPVPDEVSAQIEAKKNDGRTFMSLSFVSELNSLGIDDFGTLECYLIVGDQRVNGGTLQILDGKSAELEHIEHEVDLPSR